MNPVDHDDGGSTHIARLRNRLRRRRSLRGKYHLQPYRGHGSTESLHVSGRVFKGSPVPPAREEDTRVRNFWHMLRRLRGSVVPGAQVRVSVSGASTTVAANAQGLFQVVLDVATGSGAGEAWHEVSVELLDPSPRGAIVAARGFAIVPPAEARFGIISDIDDTVVETDVANLLRMLRLVLLTNAHTRLPFAGVAAFYRALHAGAAGPFTNPIFYVSSGPWNFYDLLTEVLDVHDIPVGPIFLKDYGLARDLLLSRGHRQHKLSAIDHILGTHRDLPFVLVGDSGQKDPEVYQAAVHRYPGRILAIYIRDVSDPIRDREVDAIAADVASLGVDMVRVHDTLAAAEHAAARGLLDPAALDDIRRETEGDLAVPGPFEWVVRGGPST